MVTLKIGRESVFAVQNRRSFSMDSLVDSKDRWMQVWVCFTRTPWVDHEKPCPQTPHVYEQHAVDLVADFR